MTCDLAEGATLEFPNSGIEVRARDTDVRAKRRHYTMGQFDVSEEAGRLISRAVPIGAAVFVKIGGYTVRRMFRPRGAVEFEQNVEGIDKAKVTLKDPRMVLKRGTVSKSWQSVTAETAVQYIFENRNDPEGVLTGYEFIDADARNRYRIGTFDYPSPFGVLDVADDIEDTLVGWSIELSEMMVGDAAKNLRASSIDIKDMTPLEAMNKVLKMFELPWWVNDEGTLMIGIDGAWGDVVGTMAGENAVALKNYGITRSHDTTNSVQVRGPFNKTRSIPDWEASVISGEDVQVIAEAKVPELSGGSDVLELNKNVSGPEELESIASAYLMDKIMDDTEGSIVVNGAASTEQELLAGLDIGDVLYVDDSIERRCVDNVVTGLFLINSVQHRISTRTGWEITLRVSRFPRPQSIRTSSVLYDPLTDKSYENFEAYKERESIEDDGSDSENFVKEIADTVYIGL